jgi:hypothetical protein
MSENLNVGKIKIVAAFTTKYEELMTSDNAFVGVRMASAALMLYTLY